MSRLSKIRAAEELNYSSPMEVAEDTKDAQILIERIEVNEFIALSFNNTFF